LSTALPKSPSSESSESKNSDLSLMRPDILEMSAYKVQDASGMIKLDAMENPFGLPVNLAQQLAARLSQVELNRYPGQEVQRLKQAITQYAQVPQGYAVVLGNGSDELISMLSMAFRSAGACALAPEPGFVMYSVSAQLQGLQYIGVPLTEEFELDLDAMLSAIDHHRPVLVYLAYPNNPSANLWSRLSISKIIQAVAAYGGWVVMDEAYQPFSSHSWLQEMVRSPQAHLQVILMRTLSKFGLAGARIGYMLAPCSFTDQIEKIRPPYNISVLNAQCALFALEHRNVFEEQASLICKERDKLVSALAKLQSVKAFNSQANMVLARFEDLASENSNQRANEVFEALKVRGILIKNVSASHPLLKGCLRFTIGTPTENESLISALHAICEVK